MHHRRRAVLATGLLLLSVVALLGITGPRASAPTATRAPSVNEIDIDLAAGTPLPPLPTVQPDGMSIVSVDQALARGLRGWFHPVRPKSITVRLVNNGILNRLCGGERGSTFPEDEQVWVVAFTQDALTIKDIAGPFYDRQPPPLFLTRYPGEPSPTPRPEPTPYPVAGGLIVIFAGAGFVTYEEALFDGAEDGRDCPTFENIQSLGPLDGNVTVLPTPTVGPPLPTPCLPDFLGTAGFTATLGVTGTVNLTTTRSITDGS